MAVSVGEWQVSELIFTKGIVGKIFDLRENGGNGTVKNARFIPFSSHFASFFFSIFFQHILQSFTAHIVNSMIL